MKRVKSKKVRKRRTGLGIIALVVLILCGIVTYNRYGLEAENAKNQKRIQELDDEMKKLEQEGKDIEDYKAHVQTKKYIEEVARDKLGLVYKDEIIFEPEDK